MSECRRLEHTNEKKLSELYGELRREYESLREYLAIATKEIALLQIALLEQKVRTKK
jgi:hypothetical protein